ncbi:MAG: peptidyl-prolyl cis-trans isomerase [Armatimonadota bacterium]
MTYRNVLIAVVAVVVIAMIAGCGNRPVATVNGLKITENELSDRLIQTAGDNVLRSMIDRELLRLAAQERGLEVTDEELAEEIEQTKAEYGTEEQFQQFLAANDLSQEEWENEVRIMVLARKLALHGIDPTEEQLNEFFEEHRERFRQPAMVSMSEIVVANREDADEVLRELQAGTASFADLASRYSLAGTRESGGERPELPIEAITQPEIQQVAQNLPVGEVSDPIEVGGSWVILRVRDRKQGRDASFETDRDMIDEQYRMAHAHSLSDILQEQIEKTNVNIIDPRFQRLNEVYTTTQRDIPQFGVEGLETGHVHDENCDH